MDKRKVSWKDLTEILGVIGIVGSLIFVAYQIQQNTNAVRSATIQASLDRSYEKYSPEFQAFIERGILPLSQDTC